MTKQEHKYAQVLRWLADGEKIQVNVNGWTTLSEEGVLRNILIGTHNEFRLAPSTIRVNGVEVPAPEREPLEFNTEFFLPDFEMDEMFARDLWCATPGDFNVLNLGLVYLRKEDAIARAKAMLLTQE